MKGALASSGAIVAGLLVTAASSSAVDAVMYSTGMFPHSPDAMPDQLFALAAAYRAAFAVAGGYVTARLAPGRSMFHAWILAGIGLVTGLGGVIAQQVSGSLGPAWYAIVVAAEAIPCVYLGARFAMSQQPTAKA